MSERIYTIKDITKADANFYNLLGADGNDVEIVCAPRACMKGARAVAVELCVDIPSHEAGKVFYLPLSPAVSIEMPAGNIMARFSEGGTPAVSVSGATIHFAFDPVATLAGLLQERYVDARRPLVSRLPFHYHLIPGPLRLQVHKMLGQNIKPGAAGFPAWPVEPAVESLRSLVKAAFKAAGCGFDNEGVRLWPGGKKFAVAISHDIDTDKSFTAVKTMAEIEESRGLRSCWNVVHSISGRDQGILGELSAFGHEIGLHGYNHDNKIAYLSGEQIMRRFDECSGFISRYQVKGFRSPSLLTSSTLDNVLSERFLWSSSTIDTDLNSIIAPRRGVCSVFPFFKGPLLEVPLTIPLDDRLITMGIKGDRFIELVMKKVEWIAETGGLAFIGNHPEPHISGNAEMLSVFEKIIDAFSRREDAWLALPSDVASFWRGLYAAD